MKEGCKRKIKHGENKMTEIQSMTKKLTIEDSEVIWGLGICPDCHGGLLLGPRGGMSINVRCEKCKHEFNVPPPGTFLVERINWTGK
jgi:hypothetical protein